MLRVNCLCYFCHQPLALSHHALCSVCLRNVMHYCKTSTCPVCGLIFDSSQEGECECDDDPPLWNELIAPFSYQHPMKGIVHRLKFEKNIAVVPLLSRLFVLFWREQRRRCGIVKPDIILCPPMHRNQLISRGFNQSVLLAKPIARMLNIPFLSTAFIKVKATPAQHGLSITARQTNLRDAFKLHPKLPNLIEGKHIAIFDDIVTTGETMKALCWLLLTCDVLSIQVWAVCRTQKN